MACIILANVNNKYAEYGLYCLTNVKYMQNMACIIWLIINMEYGLYYLASVTNKYAEYGLYYLTNLNNTYMQKMACIIWVMSIINICRIWLVLYG